MLFSPLWYLAVEGGITEEKYELKERWFSNGETEKLLLCRISSRKYHFLFSAGFYQFVLFFFNKWKDLPAILNQKDSLDGSQDGEGAYL